MLLRWISLFRLTKRLRFLCPTSGWPIILFYSICILAFLKLVRKVLLRFTAACSLNLRVSLLTSTSILSSESNFACDSSRISFTHRGPVYYFLFSIVTVVGPTTLSNFMFYSGYLA